MFQGGARMRVWAADTLATARRCPMRAMAPLRGVSRSNCLICLSGAFPVGSANKINKLELSARLVVRNLQETVRKNV